MKEHLTSYHYLAGVCEHSVGTAGDAAKIMIPASRLQHFDEEVPPMTRYVAYIGENRGPFDARAMTVTGLPEFEIEGSYTAHLMASSSPRKEPFLHNLILFKK